MRLFFATLFFTCTALSSTSLHAQSLPPTVTQALQKARVPLDALGVYVQEVTQPSQASTPLISWQADQPLQPASTMKLVTSYAALDLLGPAYSWKTSVYMTGQMAGDVLQGDLILQGGGDPRLVVENFWTLLRQIRAAGIREIQGNLILDSSWMEPQNFDAADFDGDPTRPYNVGPDALLVNFNVMNLQLHNDAGGLRVTTLTPLALQSSVNVRLVNGACGEWRDKLTPTFSMAQHKINVALSGTYPSSCGDKTWLLQPYPLTHGDYVGALFRELWQETGGQFNGEVQQGVLPVLPAMAGLVTEMRSESLPEILRDMNKYSNNVMTRLVMLTLDKEASQQAANPARAAQLIQQWFAHIGIDAQGLQMENGSGLSRTERISAYQMGRMLNHAFASPVMPELMSSLPVLGVDGTMKKRALNQAVAGHAHIKSGSLEGVRAIAGYVLAASGKRYVVVCFVNHKNAVQSSAAQDELLQWIYANG
ncbi:D-alanyl-D-alanine carboxypeptidase/D-alanyl-D-alanine endopeptidase [Solimicrobium silvestre]|uniref:PBP4: D-alanyl-D-alanine carboxypeptidase/D-alanyl-D-alanine-endopeptidase n=1 Tax=Solimicrobium silvestre TaxID=2099400 RepID=A0A2S9GXW6_9BURK|nr:D-alanyl-D-alanine carboxypeptidase/D-alanyl-D-alanine-endopeptidase [Solimicrobium silvestre]PRC92551.1 PBP4: D-alanyl-D-alanine carboxypeptidase/D-alanyl-D-alanine-endopeptidase [Solimicrobium silvestre]